MEAYNKTKLMWLQVKDYEKKEPSDLGSSSTSCPLPNPLLHIYCVCLGSG